MLLGAERCVGNNYPRKTPQYRPNCRASQMIAGRAVARTPRLTFCSVPLPQQVFTAAVRRTGPSSTQAPGEPSYDCVYGPRPVLRGVSGLALDRMSAF